MDAVRHVYERGEDVLNERTGSYTRSVTGLTISHDCSKSFPITTARKVAFRIAFEDIMFSTKVAIENKDDFFDFVTKLIDNDFNSTAYTYLDGFNEYFSYDKEIEKLYKKLEEKKLAVNHK